MKGVGAQAMLGFALTFVAIVIMLPSINSIVNSVSSYLDPVQLIVAGLIGIVLLVAAIMKLFNNSPGNSGPYYLGV